MDKLYDVFRKSPEGMKTWFASVGSLREAEACVRELRKAEPCEYYVCDLNERRVVAILRFGSPRLELPASSESFFFETAGAA
ncbi:MAG: hypothetical protein ACRD3D_15815 [Terriglobia bacterium]